MLYLLTGLMPLPQCMLATVQRSCSEMLSMSVCRRGEGRDQSMIAFSLWTLIKQTASISAMMLKKLMVPYNLFCHFFSSFFYRSLFKSSVYFRNLVIVQFSGVKCQSGLKMVTRVVWVSAFLSPYRQGPLKLR